MSETKKAKKVTTSKLKVVKGGEKVDTVSQKTIEHAPTDYVYKDGVKVEIDGAVMYYLMEMFDKLIENEIRYEADFEYTLLPGKGTEKAQRILDIEKTIEQPKFKHRITEKGVQYSRFKKYLMSIHRQAILDGKAEYVGLFKDEDFKK